MSLAGDVPPPAPSPTLTLTPPVVDKPSSAEKAMEGDGEPGEHRMPGGLSISLGGSMNVGTSSFVVNGGVSSNPLIDWGLSLTPSYSFSDSTRISASVSVNQEITKSDSDDDPQTLLFSDISLGVGRPIYRFETGTRISGGLNLRIPTSTSSRVDTLVTALGANLSAAQPVGKFAFSLNTGFRKNFHRYTHPVRDPGTGGSYTNADGLVIEDVVTGLSRTNGAELAGNTYFDGETNNTSMVLSGSLGASYVLDDHFSFAASYGLSSSWTYESYPLDEFSSPYATEGRGRRDSQTGTVSANYQASDSFSFGLGMVTAGGLWSADNQRYRFPFFAFAGGPESNMTTFFINATYTESIPL